MKKAFTLSEVLLTLTIIGVVAMMTIPTLNNNVNDMHFKAAARKTFVTLADAMSMIALRGYVDSHVPADGNTDNIKAWYNTYLSPNLRVMKVCDDREKGCWHVDGNTYGLNGRKVYCSDTVGQIGGGVITARLNDGSAINIDSYGKESIRKYFGVDIDTSAGIVVFFDVNGDKRPNKLGKDIFAAVYKDDTLVPAWSSMSVENIDKNCSKKYNGGITDVINGKSYSDFTNIAGYSCLNKMLLEDMQTHNPNL